MQSLHVVASGARAVEKALLRIERGPIPVPSVRRDRESLARLIEPPLPALPMEWVGSVVDQGDAQATLRTFGPLHFGAFDIA